MTDGTSNRKSKLAALVPPPRKNTVHYHGGLAPHAKDRDKIVPATSREEQSADEQASTPRKYRLTWAALLARTFNLNLERCSICGGPPSRYALWRDVRRRRSKTSPKPWRRRAWKGTGHSATIPEVAPARAPLQTEFEFDY